MSASVCCYAQERVLTKERFEITFKRGLNRTAGKSYRVTRTTENSIEGKPQSTTSMEEVSEFVPPNMSHSVIKRTSQSGTKRNEIIRIGEKTYTREENDEWKAELTYTPEDNAKWNEVSGKNNPKPPASTQTTITDEKEYRLFGYEMQNDQRLAVAGYVRNMKTINSANNAETVSVIVYKCWFDEHDGLMKVETDTKSQSGALISHNRRTEVYDLDPNIKIEAPIEK